jgi:hypothetical protein
MFISYVMKIRPVGAEQLHADGRADRQTDITKLIVAFRNFANAPKNGSFFSYFLREAPKPVAGTTYLPNAVSVSYPVIFVTHPLMQVMSKLTCNNFLQPVVCWHYVGIRRSERSQLRYNQALGDGKRASWWKGLWFSTSWASVWTQLELLTMYLSHLIDDIWKTACCVGCCRILPL